MKDYVYTERLISVSESDVFRCFLGILFKAAYATFDLSYDISYPFQIDSRCLQLVFRFVLSALIEHDSRSFLKDLSSVLRSRADYISDLALTDYRVALDTDSGIHEKLADISQPALVAVDEIFAFSRAEHTSCDSYFVIFKRQYSIRIVDHERDLGHALRFSCRCSGKDDILHL